MSKTVVPAVRFLLPWRGRVPGDLVSTLDYGVAAALVQRNIAEWLPAADCQPKTVGDVAPLATTGSRRKR
jgi:hypothetical protein